MASRYVGERIVDLCRFQTCFDRGHVYAEPLQFGRELVQKPNQSVDYLPVLCQTGS